MLRLVKFLLFLLIFTSSFFHTAILVSYAATFNTSSQFLVLSVLVCIIAKIRIFYTSEYISRLTTVIFLKFGAAIKASYYHFSISIISDKGIVTRIEDYQFLTF